MNTVLVSVIVPVYNSEVYLSKCLESILKQSYKKLQIIIVNDGSTDSSKDIISKYALEDNRIITIHKANGGIGSAYKAAFEVMTGDYVFFVDSDDWLELNAIENIIKTAVEHDADMVAFGIRAWDTRGERVYLQTLDTLDLVIQSKQEILRVHYEVIKHPTLARIYKRKFFYDLIVFDQNIGIDEMLTPQLLTQCNYAVYTPKKYYNAIIRGDSVCRSAYTKQKIEESIKVHRFVVDFMQQAIPNYLIYSQLKYLNLLIDIYHNSLIHDHLIDYETSILIRKDLQTTYKAVQKTELYKKNDIANKLRTLLVVKYPQIYKLIFNILGKRN